MNVPMPEFDRLVVSFAKKWNKAIPTMRHMHDRFLVFRNVNGKQMQQIVIVTPEDENSMEELIDKYLTGNYKSPEKEINIKDLLGS